MSANDSVSVYLGVIGRLEPDITSIDHDAAMASIAISLKRIADALERTAPPPIKIEMPDHRMPIYKMGEQEPGA